MITTSRSRDLVEAFDRFLDLVGQLPAASTPVQPALSQDPVPAASRDDPVKSLERLLDPATARRGRPVRP
jgi:hypothetical protein